MGTLTELRAPPGNCELRVQRYIPDRHRTWPAELNFGVVGKPHAVAEETARADRPADRRGILRRMEAVKFAGPELLDTVALPFICESLPATTERKPS
jgi:hypothetical protein